MNNLQKFTCGNLCNFIGHLVQWSKQFYRNGFLLDLSDGHLETLTFDNVN